LNQNWPKHHPNCLSQVHYGSFILTNNKSVSIRGFLMEENSLLVVYYGLYGIAFAASMPMLNYRMATLSPFHRAM